MLCRNVSTNLAPRSHSFLVKIEIGLWWPLIYGGVESVGAGVGRGKTLLALVAMLFFLKDYRSVLGASSSEITFRSSGRLGSPGSSVCSIVNVLSRLRGIKRPCILLNRLHNSLVAISSGTSFSLGRVGGFSVASRGACLGGQGCCAVVGGYGCTVTQVSATVAVHGRGIVLPRFTTVGTVQT